MRRVHVTRLCLIGLAIGGMLTNGQPHGVRVPLNGSPKPRAETTRSAPQPERRSQSRPGQTLADLDASTRHGILDAMRVARHVAGTTTLSLANPEQRVQAAIGPTRAIVTGRDGARVEFGRTTLGRAGTHVPLSTAPPTGVGTAHIEIARTTGDVAVTEWWNNTAAGLEQGFTVHGRPEGTGALEIQQRWQSPLAARLSADGAGLVLSDDSGVRLQFDHLRAWDRDGRDLPASLDLRGDTLAMVVDDARARYPVTVDPTWTQQAYLKASNTGASDSFGYAVAVSGDTVVVGAYGEDSNATGVDGDQTNNSTSVAGAAYVLVRTGTTWTQQAYLKASNTGARDSFAWSVAVSGDTLVVGAPSEGSNATGVNGNQADDSAAFAGAAYVFVRTGTTWTQQAYLKASNTESNDFFGVAVAVSGDTLVVGAYYEASNATGVNGNQSDNSALAAGAAYVFVRTGTTWTQQAYLKASNTGNSDGFGFAVAMSGDTLVVGAPDEDSNATGVNGNQADNSGVNAGAAYVFVRTGTTWTQQAYLKASNTGSGDAFGWSVAVSGDTVAVGARSEDSSATGVNGNQTDNSAAFAGAAYVFVRTGTTWTQQAYLKASNTASNDFFGFAVAVSGDTLLVAAHSEDSNATGVNGDQADNSAVSAGAAYVFVRTGATWTQQAYLKASNTGGNDLFGFAVAVSGDTVVVGAPQEASNATGVNGNQADNSASAAGAVYVFDLILDTDLDGLPDSWETQFGLDAASALGIHGANGDPDGDGRTNLQELQDGTHPRGFVTRYLAEGATSAFFSTRIALLNPTGTDDVVNLRFLRADGGPVATVVPLPAHGRRTLDVQTLPGLANAAFATVIESVSTVVADRTMTWDTTRYGSHAETSVPAPEATWYLAEGATHSGFQLFYLLQNPHDQPVTVQVEFLLPPPLAPVIKTYSVGPTSRFNIWVNTVPELVSTDVSATLTSSLPIVVERAMYLDRPGMSFAAGHESAGITAPATTWFLAEGATGPYFDLFLLIANPTLTDAQIEARFLRPDGTVVEKRYVVAGKSRFNIWVDAEGGLLADTAVSSTITSTNGVPVLVERAMWWPGSFTTWHEAHNSAGAVTAGTRWALAEGETGGSQNLQTYVLIANTSSFDGSARVTMLFEDGTSAQTIVPLTANSRSNVDIAFAFPQAIGKRFGVVVESVGQAPAQIVVERAMYADAAGVRWAAGTNALATRVP